MANQHFQVSIQKRIFGGIEKTADCWLWKGSPRPNGYCAIWYKQRSRLAHRLVYEILVGPIPEGLTIDHLCGNKRCVNPDHLEPVTQKENTLRAQKKAGILSAKTHCPQGHEYTEGNTNRSCRRRRCLTCHREREASRRLRMKERIAISPLL